MKDFGIKLVYVLGANLAVYFAVAIGITASMMTRFPLGTIELLIPGALILIGTTLLWLPLLRRYPICRRKAGAAILFLFGLSSIVFISVAYPVLRTGVLWKAPGELGGAALFMIIFLSLASQLAGFVVGFIPCALFIRRIAHSH